MRTIICALVSVLRVVHAHGVSHCPQGVEAVIHVLDRVEETAKGIPPVDNKASRFGNPAFKTFYDKVTEVRRFIDTSGSV